MAASRLRLLNSNLFKKYSGFKTISRIERPSYCTKPTEDESVGSNISKTSQGFVEFFEKQESFVIGKEKKVEKSFPTLLRQSKFMDLGDPEGKTVIGTIYRTVGDDLYIDFGWKFPTVCRRPKKYGQSYLVGAKVRLLIKDLELSTKFLGSTKDITLCEADCVLLGLAN